MEGPWKRLRIRLQKNRALVKVQLGFPRAIPFVDFKNQLQSTLEITKHFWLSVCLWSANLGLSVHTQVHWCPQPFCLDWLVAAPELAHERFIINTNVSLTAVFLPSPGSWPEERERAEERSASVSKAVLVAWLPDLCESHTHTHTHTSQVEDQRIRIE